MTEAFPWDTAPWYLLRDRDASYGPAFRDGIQVMGIKEVVTAPRSPWQNAYVERIIGSIRRECLDHIIIFNERHLRDVLSSYCKYHHKSRTHLSLGQDCPQPRPIQSPLQAPLSPSHKWAVCTIATNDAPRDPFWRPNMPARFGADRGSVEQLPRSNRMAPQGRCIGIHVVRAAGVLFD